MYKYHVNLNYTHHGEGFYFWHVETEILKWDTPLNLSICYLLTLGLESVHTLRSGKILSLIVDRVYVAEEW